MDKSGKVLCPACVTRGYLSGGRLQCLNKNCAWYEQVVWTVAKGKIATPGSIPSDYKGMPEFPMNRLMISSFGGMREATDFEKKYPKWVGIKSWALAILVSATVGLFFIVLMYAKITGAM